MPKRTDIHKILIIGSGPIVIGQACEFDYSGTQACKALRSEGYEVVLVNSNPATIMTDPELADATYVEPLSREYLEAIIERVRPDELLNHAQVLRNRGKTLGPGTPPAPATITSKPTATAPVAESAPERGALAP
jgi:hypothetical protein